MELVDTHQRPTFQTRAGPLHVPAQSTSAAAMNLDAADRFNYQVCFSKVAKGPNTLNVDVDDEFASCNLFLRKRRAKFSTS